MADMLDQFRLQLCRDLDHRACAGAASRLRGSKEWCRWPLVSRALPDQRSPCGSCRFAAILPLPMPSTDPRSPRAAIERMPDGCVVVVDALAQCRRWRVRGHHVRAHAAPRCRWIGDRRRPCATKRASASSDWAVWSAQRRWTSGDCWHCSTPIEQVPVACGGVAVMPGRHHRRPTRMARWSSPRRSRPKCAAEAALEANRSRNGRSARSRTACRSSAPIRPMKKRWRATRACRSCMRKTSDMDLGISGRKAIICASSKGSAEPARWRSPRPGAPSSSTDEMVPHSMRPRSRSGRRPGRP